MMRKRKTHFYRESKPCLFFLVIARESDGGRREAVRVTRLRTNQTAPCSLFKRYSVWICFIIIFCVSIPDSL